MGRTSGADHFRGVKYQPYIDKKVRLMHERLSHPPSFCGTDALTQEEREKYEHSEKLVREWPKVTFQNQH